MDGLPEPPLSCLRVAAAPQRRGLLLEQRRRSDHPRPARAPARGSSGPRDREPARPRHGRPRSAFHARVRSSPRRRRRARRDRLEVVRGEHLGDVAALARPRPLRSWRPRRVQRPCGCGVTAFRRRPCAAAPAGTRTDRVPASGSSSRIEDLLGHQAVEQRCDLALRPVAQRGGARRRERLAEHRGVLEQRTLVGIEAVQPGGDQRVQGLGNLQVGDVAGDEVARAVLRPDPGPAACGPSPPRTAGSPRRAGRSARPARRAARAPGHAAARPSRPSASGSRARAASQFGRRVEQLGPPERENEDRELGRPFEQVVDEVEQTAVGPLEVLERQDHRAGSSPSARRTAASRRTGRRGRRRRAPRGRSRWASRGSTSRRSRSSGTWALDSGAELLPGRRRLLLLEDPGPGPDHLRQRPVRHPLAIAQAAALMPPARAPRSRRGT